MPRKSKAALAEEARLGELGLKRCSKCGQVWSLAYFVRDSRLVSGLKAACNACRGHDLARWRASQREQANAHERRYHPSVG